MKYNYRIKLQRNKKGKAIRHLETNTTDFKAIESMAFYHYANELHHKGKAVKIPNCKYNGETIGTIEILAIERI